MALYKSALTITIISHGICSLRTHSSSHWACLDAIGTHYAAVGRLVRWIIVTVAGWIETFDRGHPFPDPAQHPGFHRTRAWCIRSPKERALFERMRYPVAANKEAGIGWSMKGRMERRKSSEWRGSGDEMRRWRDDDDDDDACPRPASVE